MSFKLTYSVNVVLVCVLGLLTIVLAQYIPAVVPDKNPTRTFPFVTSLDQEDKFILKWGYDDNQIWFQIQANTLGYVAFGISETGQMVPADIMIGYVNNSVAVLNDYYTDQYYPTMDRQSQSWTLIEGGEKDGWTILTFMRPLEACNTVEDRSITYALSEQSDAVNDVKFRDTQRLIYAYHPNDPISPEIIRKHTRKGSKSVNLLSRVPPPSSTPNTNVMMFDNNNYIIPDTETTSFHCRVFNFTEATRPDGRKYHIISARPVISPGSELFVQHMILYKCVIKDKARREALLATGDSFQCFNDAPQDIQFCREYVASFGEDKSAMYLPDDVGIPVGGPGESNVFVLATHYINEEWIQGQTDSSGIEVTYTADLRLHEGAFLTMGNIQSPMWQLFIPPGQKNFVSRAYCSRNCMNHYAFKGSDNRTMTAVGVKFHTNEAGSAMKLRHMTYVTRSTVRENPWIANDAKYDSKAQGLRMLKTRRTVGLRDLLQLECSYDTTFTATPLLGGWMTDNELCRAYVLYYPRQEIEGCNSWSNYDQLKDTNNRPVSAANVFTSLYGVNWSDHTTADKVRKNMRHALDNSVENAQCWSSKANVEYASDRFKQPRIIGDVYTDPSTSTCPPPTG